MVALGGCRKEALSVGLAGDNKCLYLFVIFLFLVTRWTIAQALHVQGCPQWLYYSRTFGLITSSFMVFQISTLPVKLGHAYQLRSIW
jgi:hypothetical protein